MKRGLAVLFLSLILLSIIASSVIAEDDKVAKGYTCLEGKVKGKCSSLATIEEQAVSLLALAYSSDIQKDCSDSLRDKSSNDKCWPKSGCKLKETSLVTLAFQHINADSSKPEAWLLRQNKTPDDLTWYLEIDAKEATSCKIKYDTSNSTQNTVTMNSGKKLSLSGSSCLSLAQGNYWLQISPSCLSKNFKVSCDKDFQTALLYKKTGSDVWFVSSQTQSASANGETENQVSSLCFQQSGACNYEGSLWATLALSKKQDVTAFLPYLIALAPDNEQLDPYAFLYILTSSDEYAASLRDSQNPAGYWDFGSSYSRFYDTALSLLAFQQLADDTSEKSRTWLLSTQSDNGCWNNNIRDTALILYSGWPREPAAISTSPASCEDYKFFCSASDECTSSNGEILDDYECSGLKVCCSKKPVQKTCSEKDGVKCSSGETCSGDSVPASDTTDCCIGTCKKAPEKSECDNQGLTCNSVCSETQEIKDFECTDNSQVCCGPKPPESKSYWWVYVLILLIILVVLGIVFRNRLRMLVFQLKNRFKNRGNKGPVSQTRPPFPPQPPMGRPMMRPMPMRGPQPSLSKPVQQKPKTKSDEEFEATLKKLKDMSK